MQGSISSVYTICIWSFSSSLPSARKIPAGFTSSLELDCGVAVSLEAGVTCAEEPGTVLVELAGTTALELAGSALALEVGVTPPSTALEAITSPELLESGCVEPLEPGIAPVEDSGFTEAELVTSPGTPEPSPPCELSTPAWIELAASVRLSVASPQLKNANVLARIKHLSAFDFIAFSSSSPNIL